MTNPSQLTTDEIEAKMALLWTAITEYYQRYNELKEEQDRRQRPVDEAPIQWWTHNVRQVPKPN